MSQNLQPENGTGGSDVTKEKDDHENHEDEDQEDDDVVDLAHDSSVSSDGGVEVVPDTSKGAQEQPHDQGKVTGRNRNM